MKEIYMDHAATTPLAPAVLEAMLPYFGEKFGNASTVYRRGQRARMAIEDSRRRIAAVLHARPEEICFTSGGSESDNMALRGGLAAARKRAAAGEVEKNHIIVSAIEHHAVLHTCEALAAEGVEITYLPVDERGLVSPAAVAAALQPETALVSVMSANNEIGTLQPIAEIGSICREAGVLFHTDAVQAFGQIPLDVQALQVDLLSASAHKLNGPQGWAFCISAGDCSCRRCSTAGLRSGAGGPVPKTSRASWASPGPQSWQRRPWRSAPPGKESSGTI